MIRQIICGAGLILALGGSARSQDAEQCRYTVDNYNNAVSDISSRLRRYSSCVANSNGYDDCSSEFRRLRSAQSEFETYVSQYQSYCQ